MRGVLWAAVVLGTLVSSVSAGLAVPVAATEEVVEGRDLNGHGQIPLGSTLSSSSSSSSSSLSSSSASSSPLEFDQSQSPHLGEEASSTIFDNTPNPQHPETYVPYHDQKPTVIIQSNTDTHTDADTKEKESSAQILKSQISELDRLRDAYLQLENELKKKTERVNSMSKSLCGPKSIWECETRPFCMLSVLFGWSRKPNENARMGTGMRIDVGQCLNRLEKLERIQNGDDGRKGEIPARLQEEYAKGKERSLMRRVLCELGIVLLGSMMVIGIGCMLRGSAKAEELPFFEPRQAEHDDRRTGFWRRLFRVSVVLRRRVRGPRGDDEEADGEDEKDDVERVREEQVVIHEEVLAPPRPRHYARREIEEHIESWGMGVQQEMMNEYSSQEQEAVLQAEEQEGREGQIEEDDCESEQDSEPGSVDSMQGVTMEDEIASFRDAFGLVADMLAAVEQRRR